MRTHGLAFWLILIACGVFCASAFSQQSASEPRLALIMGVGDYGGTKFPTLPGIDFDLKRMETALKATGFKVTVVPNPTLTVAEEAIETFGARLKAQAGGVGLFYFSGHGGEFEGKNYLIPKGARIGSNRDIKEQAVAAQRVLNRMEDAGARVNIVFLDCCRNDLTKAATDTGLAAMNAKGSFIGFATGTDKTSAASTEGSPYTSFLAKRLLTPGVSILDMHTLVTADVEDFAKANSLPEQTPFQYSSLRSSFVFLPGGLTSRPSADENPATFKETTISKGRDDLKNKIVLIPLLGPIFEFDPEPQPASPHFEFRMVLDKATADESVSAIVISINSPGGEFASAEFLFQAVIAARAHKPVVIYMASTAAAGGYYISCAGNYVMAAKTTVTGGIGVFTARKSGDIIATFKSGRLVDTRPFAFGQQSPGNELHDASPLSVAELESVQKLVMERFDHFVETVAKERKIPQGRLREGAADGRLVSGREAVALGLIDQTGAIEGAYEKARVLGRTPGAAIVKYERVMSGGTNIQKMDGEPRVGRLELGRFYSLAK